MSIKDDSNGVFSDEEISRLKSLAKPATAEALERIAVIPRDYEAWGRMGAFLWTTMKYAGAIVALVALSKSGLINFLDLG